MAKNGYVDLHLHSHFSCDGDYSPEELIRMARENGFQAISIADHDSVEAYPEAIELGLRYGIEVIPNIEVTTVYDSREFHLLLPLVNWESEVVKYIIKKMEKSRLEEARSRVERLKENGLEVDWEEVWRLSGQTPPLGVKIAQIVLGKEKNRRNPTLEKYYDEHGHPLPPYLFYQDFFAEGGLAYVPKKHISLEEVLSLAPLTGGVPVLSHPGAYFQRATREDLLELKKIGLKGIEVFTSYHTEEQVNFYLQLAEELELVPTAGSDFHGQIKPRVHFGMIKAGDYSMIEKLREKRS